jgi:hypothetical protein
MEIVVEFARNAVRRSRDRPPRRRRRPASPPQAWTGEAGELHPPRRRVLRSSPQRRRSRRVAAEKHRDPESLAIGRGGSARPSPPGGVTTAGAPPRRRVLRSSPRPACRLRQTRDRSRGDEGLHRRGGREARGRRRSHPPRRLGLRSSPRPVCCLRQAPRCSRGGAQPGGVTTPGAKRVDGGDRQQPHGACCDRRRGRRVVFDKNKRGPAPRARRPRRSAPPSRRRVRRDARATPAAAPRRGRGR